MASVVNTLEARAVGTGAAVTVFVAVPFSIARRTVDDATSSLVLLFFVGTLLAFVAGGYVGARLAASAPYSNSAVAAAAGWAIVQTVTVILMVRRGDAVNLVVIVANGLAAYACGLAGGLLASRSPTTGVDRP